MTLSGTYDVPLRKGRRLLGHAPPVVNAILGGWSTSHLFAYNSGQFIRFGPLAASGNPKLDNPTRDRYFDTSKFQQLPAFTPRLNPWQYEGVTGPIYWNPDRTLSKVFPVRERYQLEFKMEAYNLTNSFIPSNPNTTDGFAPARGKRCARQLSVGFVWTVEICHNSRCPYDKR